MRIAITDKVHPLLIEGLRAKGYEVVYDTSLDNEALELLLPELDGVIINSKIKMTQPRIDLGHKLRFIGRLGSGMEIIDVAYAKSKGIKCINTPDGNCDAVGEHAMGMLLAFANNIIRANAETKQGIWRREENRGFELMGKTIGIVGVGHTGEAFARRLSGFGIKVLGYDKYKSELSPGLEAVQLCDLATIQREADIISFHLPLTAETKHMASDAFLSGCKKGVVIINTSRGEVIDTMSLVKHLATDQVKGACLDVFENEKVQSHTVEEAAWYKALSDNEAVIMTPHIAGWTHESLHRIASLILERILAALA